MADTRATMRGMSTPNLFVPDPVDADDQVGSTPSPESDYER